MDSRTARSLRAHLTEGFPGPHSTCYVCVLPSLQMAMPWGSGPDGHQLGRGPIRAPFAGSPLSVWPLPLLPHTSQCPPCLWVCPVFDQGGAGCPRQGLSQRHLMGSRDTAKAQQSQRLSKCKMNKVNTLVNECRVGVTERSE